MNKLETHYYDGVLNNRLKEIYKLEEIKKLSVDEKRIKIDQLKEIINPYLSVTAKNVFQIIYNSIGTNNNYDHTNHMSADDLLCLALEYIDVGDFIILLNTQLEEMLSGLCPQGRTHRLLQIIVAMQ